MKKILKVFGIIFVVFIVIGIIGSKLMPVDTKPQQADKGETPTTIQKPTDNIHNSESPTLAQKTDEFTFTKDEALKKIQEYKITIDLKSPDVPKGTTIIEAYEIKGKVPAIKNLGWFTEDTTEEGKYIVGYKQTVSDNLPQEPRWEVTKDSIKALNGKAITITPEFGPK